ncbi:MAG: HAD family hydrolase [Nitriliruptorales bacterium]
MTLGLILDYGGVLTSSAAVSFRAFERNEGLPRGVVFDVIAEAYADAAGGDDANPIARFERGESTAEEFGAELARRLGEHGHDVDPTDIHQRIFAESEPARAMWGIVRQARAAGVRTALLSNSWGTDHYPVDEFEAHFDVVVISGEVGLRKPDPAIYRLTAERLGLPPERCVFVDDLDRNVEAAREVGMNGVHHFDFETTVEDLSRLLGVELGPEPPEPPGAGAVGSDA